MAHEEVIGGFFQVKGTGLADARGCRADVRRGHEDVVRWSDGLEMVYGRPGTASQTGSQTVSWRSPGATALFGRQVWASFAPPSIDRI